MIRPFSDRHVGPDATEAAAMLGRLGCRRLEGLLAAALPAGIASEHAAAAAGRRVRGRGTRRAACARGPQPAGAPADRHRLLAGAHAQRAAARRAGEPGLVHRLHAVSAGDQPGPARGAAHLPDDGHRPDRARRRQRQPARRGHRCRRGDGVRPPGGARGGGDVRHRRRLPSADDRRRLHAGRCGRRQGRRRPTLPTRTSTSPASSGCSRSTRAPPGRSPTWRRWRPRCTRPARCSSSPPTCWRSRC